MHSDSVRASISNRPTTICHPEKTGPAVVGRSRRQSSSEIVPAPDRSAH